MDEKLSLAEQNIEQQIAKINSILDKREVSGQQLDVFLSEERTRLYGMLQIYWLVGGVKFEELRH